jgi:hypothetical protein
MQIQQDKYGFYFYPELPPGWRVAAESDFKDMQACFDCQKPFLLLGDESKVYVCYRVKGNFSIDKISYWLEKGKIFVMEDKPAL